MDYLIRSAKRLRGRWQAAGDKSITHRAFLMNALAEGEALISGANMGEDCARSRRILEQLGVSVEAVEKGSFRVRGGGGRFRAPDGTLDAGNSGTTLRLAAGLLASQPFAAILDGDDSLRQRPMERIAAPLAALGARCDTTAGCPPLSIQGAALRGCGYDSPVASAQVKSAFLLAALRAEGESAFREPRLSRDHTERLLERMGASLARDEEGWIRLTGPQTLRAVDVPVPGDPSSAAFPIAAALLVEGGNLIVKNLSVNPTRSGFLKVVERMGGRLALYHPREAAGEPIADLLVQHSSLRAVDVTPEEVPSLVDEVPLLAVLASHAPGESRFQGLAELRVKESDRLERSAALIRAFGGDARVEDDALLVVGGKTARAAQFDAGNDHRLAMAAAVQALTARGESRILNIDCVGTSFPEFPSLMKRLTRDALQVVEAES